MKRSTTSALLVALMACTAWPATDASATDLTNDHFGGSTAYWSGIYVGVHGGYSWGDKDWTLIRNAGGSPSNRIGQVITSHDTDDWLGGVHVGLNHQFRHLLVGIEGEFSWTGSSGYSTWTALGGPNAGAFRDASTDINWIATLTGRAGLTFGRSLVFVKGGAAWADEDYTHTGGSLTRTRYFVGNETRVGWLVGVGIEHTLHDNWSIKAEYNYIDFGKEQVSVTDGDRTAIFGIDQEMHTVKLGLSYRFNWERERVPYK